MDSPFRGFRAIFYKESLHLRRDSMAIMFALLIPLVEMVILGAAMVAWMRFRQMAWAPTLEMAGSSVVAAVVLIAAYWAGVVAAEALVPSVCVLACVLMVGVMLFRLPLYTASHAHHGKAP